MIDNSLLAKWALPEESQVTATDTKGRDTVHRYVIKSEKGAFMLTGHDRSEREAVYRTGELVDALSRRGVSLLNPLRSTGHEVVEYFGETVYMLTPLGTPVTADDILRPDCYRTVVKNLKSLREITEGTGVFGAIKKRELFPEEAKVRLLINSSSGEDQQFLRSLFEYCEEELIRYLPYMATCLCHGDLHPGNIVSLDNRAVFIDWEHVFFGPPLYDLAFLTGCIGLNGRKYVRENALKPLLAGFASAVKPDRLSVETFLPLVVLTRMLWLDRWYREHDFEMIVSETAYLRWLYGQREDTGEMWKQWLEENQRGGTVKWVVQDAVYNEETQQHKELLETASITTVEAYLAAAQITEAQAAEYLRTLVIAFGKDTNVTKIIDVIAMQEELYSRKEGEPHFLKELGFTYANASLDFARVNLPAAIEKIIGALDRLSQKYPDSIDTAVALSFVLRNYSILLSERGTFIDSYRVIDTIKVLYDTRGNNLEIGEEYARALSSGVITALQNHDRQRLNDYITLLESLGERHPGSKKIHGAILFARKNITQHL